MNRPIHRPRLEPLGRFRPRGRPHQLEDSVRLRKRRFWKEGERIVPVNRNAGSEARRIFDDGIFDFGPRQLASYWNRQYFLGVLPPPTLASDEAVLRFVAGEPRAIGYVLIDAVDDTVRVVMRIGTPSRVSSKAPPSP